MSNINEAQLKQQYEQMNATQLNEEFMKIASIPNARTNIEALTKISILMPIFEERDIALPSASRASASGSNNGGMPRSIDAVASQGRSSQRRPQYAEPESSVNVGSLILGIVILLIGIGLTSTGAGVFYGAILVGLYMIVKSFL